MGNRTAFPFHLPHLCLAEPSMDMLQIAFGMESRKTTFPAFVYHLSMVIQIRAANMVGTAINAGMMIAG